VSCPSGGAVIVDQDVEPAERIHRHGHRAPAIVRIARIRLNGQNFAAGLLADCVGCALQGRFAACHQSDPRALSREKAGDAVSDAHAGAANEGDLVLEVQVHGAFRLSKNRSALR
jgi:hypothetical protein